MPLELRGNLGRNWSSVDTVPGPGNRLDQQPRWSGKLVADVNGARGMLYANALGATERDATSATYRSLRLQYERKFEQGRGRRESPIHGMLRFFQRKKAAHP
ncbi:hypothetical protein AB4Z32_03155 [Massilia sp. 2TAF26]|uniref:hypothetical protein n=1 Tax=Massilia sp. 2TAF26 TaxID=3233012 RepID=UPI003F955AA2